MQGLYCPPLLIIAYFRYRRQSRLMSLIPGVAGGEEGNYHSDTPPTNTNSETPIGAVENTEFVKNQHESPRKVICYYFVGPCFPWYYIQFNRLCKQKITFCDLFLVLGLPYLLS